MDLPHYQVDELLHRQNTEGFQVELKNNIYIAKYKLIDISKSQIEHRRCFDDSEGYRLIKPTPKEFLMIGGHNEIHRNEESHRRRA